MPQLSTQLQKALRAAVTNRFGQAVRYPSDCDTLENDISRAAAKRVSPSTLRRFFGLVQKEGGYHLHTLDALARYAGHVDFASFEQAVLKQVATVAGSPPDMLVLLAMPELSYSARLLLGYYTGLAERPAQPTGPASPLALRLAAHPVGQEVFVESFVDLATLTGAYGEILTEYLRHKHTAEAKLFGHATLFLRELLIEDESAWRIRLQQLREAIVPTDTHAFPLGRRAFAEVLAAWHDAPDQQIPLGLLRRLRDEAATIPTGRALSADLPAFYNYFPAGYHFFVAEALFLTSQFAALADWLTFTATSFPELAHLEGNVYNELLRVFESAAHCCVGKAGTVYTGWQALLQTEMRSWLLDYYQLHFELANLYVATCYKQASIAIQKRDWIAAFASRHGMPFFNRLAQMAIKPLN